MINASKTNPLTTPTLDPRPKRRLDLNGSLAEMLKAKGLAKDYDGEGERPEW